MQSASNPMSIDIGIHTQNIDLAIEWLKKQGSVNQNRRDELIGTIKQKFSNVNALDLTQEELLLNYFDELAKAKKRAIPLTKCYAILEKFKIYMIEKARKKNIKHWDDYSLAENMSVTVELSETKQYAVNNYTEHFLNDHGFGKHLNIACKSIVQLGIGHGVGLRSCVDDILAEKTKEAQETLSSWNLIGYDYSPISIQSLNTKGITARQIDLDSIQENQLTYSHQLAEDIKSPTNIFLIRVLWYLDSKAVTLLLHLMSLRMLTK